MIEICFDFNRILQLRINAEKPREKSCYYPFVSGIKLTLAFHINGSDLFPGGLYEYVIGFN